MASVARAKAAAEGSRGHGAAMGVAARAAVKGLVVVKAVEAREGEGWWEVVASRGVPCAIRVQEVPVKFSAPLQST